MVFKRKGTTRIAKAGDAASAASKNIEEAEEGEDPTMDAEEEEQEEEVQETEEDRIARIEAETVATRKKELKSMSVSDMKALMDSNGLEKDGLKKEEMTKALLAHEAKVRETKRAKEAKIREVIVKKKDELEALSVSELSKMCNTLGIQGVRAKQERIRLILESWQKDDGVEKALKEIARQERISELQEMEVDCLRSICEANDIDPYVKEVMADRAVKVEKAAGHFSRPSMEDKKEASEKGKAPDLVDALVANEASRKAVQKKQVEKEDANKAKMKDLKGMSVEDLKKALKKHGSEIEGKKEELVEALYAIHLQEEALKARKAELKAMAQGDLKTLISEKAIECGHGKEKMIEAILNYESEVRDKLKDFDAKAIDILAQKKEELDWMTNAELKELCSSKSLAVGGGKEDRVARLLEQSKTDGEVDSGVSAKLFEERKEAILKMERSDLVMLCDSLGVDPYVKEVLIERVLAFEDDSGVIAEPPRKKARKCQK